MYVCTICSRECLYTQTRVNTPTTLKQQRIELNNSRAIIHIESGSTASIRRFVWHRHVTHTCIVLCTGPQAH